MRTSRIAFVAAVLVASWVIAAPARAQAGGGKGLFAALNLTDTQKAEIKAIRQETQKSLKAATTPAAKLAIRQDAREQIEGLLTPEQKAKLAEIRQKAAEARDARMTGVLAQLDLTKKQEAQIAVIRSRTRVAVAAATTPAEKKALVKAAWDDIKALLTPAQLAKLKELRKADVKAGAGFNPKLLAQLDLTDAQKVAIKAIRQSTQTALDAAATPEAKRAIMKAARQQIKALLTPEQLAKLKELREKK
jgi:Spy/CpxP family protein refolding chaperone